jgi:type II restriction enzyme
MSLNVAEYKKKAHQAVKEFWGNREEAKARQIASGRADQGERSGVTSGKNMDGFLSLIIDIIRLNGLDSAQIYINRAMLSWRPQQWCNFPGTPTPATPGWAAHLRRLA